MNYNKLVVTMLVQTVLLLLGTLLLGAHASTLMWFDKSAIVPIGNGRLGAEIMGKNPTETIFLNEDHIWSGSLNNPANKNCPAALPGIRNLIWQGSFSDAQSRVDASCMGIPPAQQMFQTAGSMDLAFGNSGVSNLNHSLDFTTAIASTTYNSNGVQFTRQAFASYPDNVIVYRVTANQAGKVGFTASFKTPMASPSYSASNNLLTMTAAGQSKNGLAGAIKYVVRAEITTKGGSVGASGSTLVVSGADEALVVIAIDTNFVRYDNLSANPDSKVSSTLSAVRGKTWDQLRTNHLNDYQALFGRVSISLGTPSQYTYQTTNTRKSFPGGVDADQDVFALYAQYGRYLSIASSRKTEPANLQGIWNEGTDPAWGSKYTININQQMNSWLAEPLNVAETLNPLWNMLGELAERGKQLASDHYNIKRGWVAHHNTNLWRDSAPIDGAVYGMWPAGSAWLMQHVWEHYAYDPSNTDWVKNVGYPMMKGAAEFYLDFLVETPQSVESQRYLVTSPSMSPENRLPGGTSLTYGPTIDSALLRDLFNHTAGIARDLGIDSDFANNLTTTMDRLIPIRVGSQGQIQEWAKDINTGAFNHISQLYPLFPGAQIDPRFNTNLVNAAKTTLQLRGDSENGWPTAWRANCFARLLDGEKAYYYMQRLLKNYSYDNLWSINLVFQIDGNFGGAMAVAEMILQSHNGEIHLLPAIPSSWKEGRVTGFRARGGFTVDIAWSNGVLTSANLKSTSGTFARVRYRGTAINLTLQKGASRTLSPTDFGGTAPQNPPTTTTGGTVPTNPPSSGTAAHWAQCGGLGWTGPTGTTALLAAYKTLELSVAEGFSPTDARAPKLNNDTGAVTRVPAEQVLLLSSSSLFYTVTPVGGFPPSSPFILFTLFPSSSLLSLAPFTPIMNGYPHRSRYDVYESAGIDSKIVIMGNSGVGKTSLLYRYTQNKFDPKNTTSTSGAFFVTKKVFVNNVKVRLQLWDTAGQERFRSMVPLVSGANAALVLYDITNSSTFQDVRGWLEELKKNCPPDLIIYIVGSKADLSKHRQVTPDFARLSLHNWFPPPRKAPPPPPPPPQPSTLSYIRPRFTSFPGISPRPQIALGEGQTSSSSLSGDLAHSSSLSGRPSGIRRSQTQQQQHQPARANTSSALQRPQLSRFNSQGYTALSDKSNSNSTNSINEEDEDGDTREDEEEWGLSKGMELFEVSAKDDSGEHMSIPHILGPVNTEPGIAHLFDHLIKAIIERRDVIETENELKKRDSVFLSATPTPTWAAQAEEEEAREKKEAARGGWSSSCC
ncbi:hypothetical protein VNI00_000966 [Paramarasmius palmivorus]|uniref:Glycoside hydrolase family 95 protein n=1 Tax=Paramarasmius palmivorus TaxID=297713 RepID=A0AAW0E9L0_9AGAR